MKDVFLTGATGYLGHELTRCLEQAGISYRALGRDDGIDLLDPFGLAIRFEEILQGAGSEPVLIHAAAMSRYYACEQEPEVAWRVNMEATGALTSVLRRRSGRIVYVSTDLVFDGDEAPYDETSEARPVSVYGKSKLAGERMALGCERGVVARIPLLYGPSFDGRRGASDPLLSAVRAAQPFRLFVDEWRTPLRVAEAAARIVDLLEESDAAGIRHFPGPERLSRWEFGQRVVAEAGLSVDGLEQASRLDLDGAPRPADCSLTTVADED